MGSAASGDDESFMVLLFSWIGLKVKILRNRRERRLCFFFFSFFC